MIKLPLIGIFYHAPPGQSGEQRGREGCIIFLYYLMTCTKWVRKTESNFRGHSGYYSLLLLKWYPIKNRACPPPPCHARGESIKGSKQGGLESSG